MKKDRAFALDLSQPCLPCLGWSGQAASNQASPAVPSHVRPSLDRSCQTVSSHDQPCLPCLVHAPSGRNLWSVFAASTTQAAGWFLLDVKCFVGDFDKSVSELVHEPRNRRMVLRIGNQILDAGQQFLEDVYIFLATGNSYINVSADIRLWIWIMPIAWD